MNLEEVITAQAVVAKPGDTLVVAFQRPLNADEASMIKERCDALIPDITVVVIDQATLGLIQKDAYA